MQNKRNFLQKMIIIVFLLLVIIQISSPTVQAVLLNEEWSTEELSDGLHYLSTEENLLDNVIFGNDRKLKHPLVAGSTSTELGQFGWYYVYTDEGGTRHITILEQDYSKFSPNR